VIGPKRVNNIGLREIATSHVCRAITYKQHDFTLTKSMITCRYAPSSLIARNVSVAHQNLQDVHELGFEHKSLALVEENKIGAVFNQAALIPNSIEAFSPDNFS
jgi:hypothetical protein